MAPPHVQLFGGFTLTARDRLLPSLTRARHQAFLAYLLLYSRQPHPRATMAACFWPESPDQQANKNLRVLLVEVRQHWPTLDHFVQIERTTLSWQPAQPVQVDLFAFESALQNASTAQQANDVAGQIAAYECAVTTYRGPFLPHLYDEWVQAPRTLLADQYKSALTALALLYQAQGRLAETIQTAQRLQAYDPLSDVACHLLLDCYPLQGEVTRALQSYQSYETTLQRELGVAPEAALTARYLDLLHQQRQPKGYQAPQAPPAVEAAPNLVGRTAEWQQLLGQWRNAQPATPRFILLTGEAGIGKTQLAEQFLRWARVQGATVAAAKCYAFGGSSGEEAVSYAPVVTWLRAEGFAAPLLRLNDRWLVELLRLLPELHSERPDLALPEPLRHGLQRRQFFEALAHAIGATGRPLLLFVDDLQWCDRETLDWLLYLLLQFPLTTPLLIVGALRSGEIADQHPYHPWRAQLRYHQRWQEVALARLNATETTQVAQEVVTQAAIHHPLSTTFGELLHRHTEGNPLFIVETMRALLPDLARDEPANWTQSLRTAIATGSLPPKVQAVIEQRLALLSTRALPIVELGAVIGRAFAVNILHELSSNEEDLVTGLDELLRRQLIHEQGAERYDFTHDRLREVVYARLSQQRRRLFHRQIALALETIHATDLDPVSAQIALHYEQAGHLAQAITFYDRAARSAQRLYANDEAVGHLRRSLALVQSFLTTDSSQAQDLSTLLMLGIVFTAAHRLIQPKLEQSLVELQQNPALAETQLKHFVAMRGMCEVERKRFNFRPARAYAEKLVTAAQELAQTELAVIANAQLGLVCIQMGDYGAAHAAMQQMIAAYQLVP